MTTQRNKNGKPGSPSVVGVLIPVKFQRRGAAMSFAHCHFAFVFHYQGGEDKAERGAGIAHV